jgi:hypothetical protein
MYFSELDAIAAVLPLKPRGSGEFDAPPGGCRAAVRPPAIRRRASPGAASCFASGHRPLGIQPLSQRPAQVRGYKTLARTVRPDQEAVRQADAPPTFTPTTRISMRWPTATASAARTVAAQFALLDAAFGALLAAIAGSDTPGAGLRRPRLHRFAAGAPDRPGAAPAISPRRCRARCAASGGSSTAMSGPGRRPASRTTCPSLRPLPGRLPAPGVHRGRAGSGRARPTRAWPRASATTRW